MPDLPQEIVDQILENLGGDVKSLLACTLVHSNWTFPSRRELLHTQIRFHFSDNKAQKEHGRITSLCQSLSRDPALGKHIYSLDLCLASWEGNAEWNDTIPTFLDSLDRLKTLKLTLLFGESLTQKYKMSIARILALPSLRDFSLKSINLPRLSSSIWSNDLSPAMLTIDMDATVDVTSFKDAKREHFGSVKGLVAKRYSIQACYASLLAISQWLFDSSILSPIHRLRLSGSYHAAFDRLLRLSASSLEILELEHGFDSYMEGCRPLVETHISHLPHLRHLTVVRGSIGSLLAKLFAGLHGDHRLETIIFKQNMLRESEILCADLDEVLSQQSLVSLSKVGFDFMHLPSPDLQERLLASMPKLGMKRVACVMKAV